MFFVRLLLTKLFTYLLMWGLQRWVGKKSPRIVCDGKTCRIEY